MNVTIFGCRYAVREPSRRRYFVSKDKKCTCGATKCLHVEAVSLYLKMGGVRAPEDKRPTLLEQAEHIKAAHQKALADTTQLHPMALALLTARRATCEADRLAWLKLYALPQMWQ